MGVKSYRELIVRQQAMDVVEMIYQVTKQFPKEETYGLTNQIRRAAVSVPSNIAEGQERKSTPDFKRFLAIAQGSRAEVETQLLLAQRLAYLTREQLTPILNLLEEISKMTNSLRAKLK